METTTPTSGKTNVQRIPQNSHFLQRSAFTIGSFSKYACDAAMPLSSTAGQLTGVRAELNWPLLLGNLEVDAYVALRGDGDALIPGQGVGKNRASHHLM